MSYTDKIDLGKLSIASIQAMDYKSMCALCGVDPDKSPDDFYWDSIKLELIANLSATAELAIEENATKAMVEAANKVYVSAGKAPITEVKR